MALIDVRCLTCGTVFEAFRSAADWPKTPPCEKCAADTEQVHFPKGTDITAPAVVLYKTPDGSFRFPGSDDPHSRTAKNYAKLGYERVEVRGFAEVRRIESQVNARQASEIRRRVERQCEQREAGMAIKRSEVRHGLAQGFQILERDERGRLTGRMKTVKLSERGRDLMQAAMARNDRKPGPRAFDAGFHVDVFSNNRSNRDESRGPDGRRYRD